MSERKAIIDSVYLNRENNGALRLSLKWLGASKA